MSRRKKYASTQKCGDTFLSLLAFRLYRIPVLQLSTIKSITTTPPNPSLQPPTLYLSLSDLHGLEVCGELGAAELELLDNVGDLLEAVYVPVLVPLSVGYH